MMYGTTQEAWGLIFEEYNLLSYFFLTICITIFISVIFIYLKNTITIPNSTNKVKILTFVS